MVNALAGYLIALAALGQGPDAGPTEIDPTRSVGSALGKGSFPWYDPRKDEAKPIPIRIENDVKPASSAGNSGGLGWFSSVGDLIAKMGFLVALGALVALLVWFWRMYEPIDSGEGDDSSKGRGEPSRIESLPPGMRREFESSDPWEEALRRRDRGDLAGAVVCLFAHQLLTLARLGLVRLAPGRTGRQLLGAVVDAEFRGLVRPTLRLFEVVYYGHRTPSSDEFAALWANAEAFERRVAGGVAA